jgi:putative PIN family toxin of toxin-antitoxin system
LPWRGTPYQLFQHIGQDESLLLFTSSVLLEELAEVLARPLAAKRLALIERTARDLVDDYIEAVEMVTPNFTPAAITADPDDDHVIAAAVAAHAELIVSGDRHLLDLGRYDRIRIVKPADAVGLLVAR